MRQLRSCVVCKDRVLDHVHLGHNRWVCMKHYDPTKKWDAYPKQELTDWKPTLDKLPDKFSSTDLRSLVPDLPYARINSALQNWLKQGRTKRVGIGMFEKVGMGKSARPRVICPECKEDFHEYSLVRHRVTQHGIVPEQYRKDHGDEETKNGVEPVSTHSNVGVKSTLAELLAPLIPRNPDWLILLQLGGANVSLITSIKEYTDAYSQN